MTPKKIGYLGPEGTYCQEAMGLYLKGEDFFSPEPFSEIPDILTAVAEKRLDQAVVPIENSIEGSVNITLDALLENTALYICAEIILPVRHHLLGKKEAGQPVARILSHPQALAQCRNYLSGHYPGVPRENAASTAEAARLVAGSAESWVAVANLLAADKYGLAVIATDIQDYPDNETRFIVVCREMVAPTGRDVTSLAFSMAKDRPGGLYEMLGEFAKRKINLTKIESRPSKKGLGDYLFLVDCEGHIYNSPLKEVADDVSKKASYYRLLGSYPMARGE